MDSVGKIISFSKDLRTQKSMVTLLLDTKDMEEIEKLFKAKVLQIDINYFFKKRSLEANRYFWELLSKYSEEKQVNTIDEYKERVKRLGIFRQFKIEAENIKTFEKIWTSQGIAWFCEINDTEFIGKTEFKIINAYYGSSSFNTKQMSRLINDLIEDCKEVDVETKSEKEIESLLEAWK